MYPSFYHCVLNTLKNAHSFFEAGICVIVFASTVNKMLVRVVLETATRLAESFGALVG